MALAGKLERPKSLTDLAVERIRSTIVEGKFALGEQLSEVALANDLGISKTPVREALFQLKMEGLVDVHPQRGTFVFQPSEEEVREICSFRELIECAALARAMEYSREELVQLLRPLLKETEAAGRRRNAKAIPDLDARFHEAIIEASHSSYLASAYSLVASKIRALRSRLPENDEQIGHCNDVHGQIVAEIESGTIARAQKVLREHIRSTQDSYLAARHNTRAVNAG